PQSRWPVQSLAEVTRTSERLARLGRGQTLCRGERPSQGSLQIELLFLARNAVGHVRKEVETLPELCHSFDDRPSWNGLLSRLEPVAHRLLRQSGFRAMLGKHCRLLGQDLRELVFQGRRDAPV